MLGEEKVASCFVRPTISWSSNESSRKRENIALISTMTKQWNSLLPQLDWHHFTRDFVCTTHLWSAIKIITCLTGHMTILSGSNYRVGLKVNMNIADSRILCSSLLFADDLFSVCFLELFVFPSHVALHYIFAFLLMLFLVLFSVPLVVFCLF